MPGSNQNFGLKIEILDKNRNLHKNRGFGQKSGFRHEHLSFRQKPEILMKNRSLGRKAKFC